MASSDSGPETPDRRVLVLAPEDNVAVLCTDLEAGTAIALDGVPAVLDKALPLGHKIARRAIRAGEKIVKYGAPIGSATQDIQAGAHVHLHNMKSDYLPTYAPDGSSPHTEAR
jgi:altronate dehydratase small subunit